MYVCMYDGSGESQSHALCSEEFKLHYAYKRKELKNAK